MLNSPQANIIERVARDNKHDDFKKEAKLTFLVYKLTVEEIFTNLKKENLRNLPKETLSEYENGLNEISAGFFDLYEDELIGNKLIQDDIQPLIDGASTKLSTALVFKDENKIEEYLDRLKACRFQLFKLKEYLDGIDLTPIPMA